MTCSRIAHIERAHKPYAPDLSSAMRRNALRVAEIWLDDYKRNVMIAWNIPLKVPTLIYTHTTDKKLGIFNF